MYKDWDAMGSEIGALEPFGDDEQPLPQNVRATRRPRWQQLQLLKLLAHACPHC